MSIDIRLIGRSGCHLCEVAQGDLASVIARFAAEYPAVEYVVEDLDIDQNPQFAHFTDEVPVLLVNGEQVAFWRIEQDRVFAQLEKLV
jgi:hypothetical protein